MLLLLFGVVLVTQWTLTRKSQLPGIRVCALSAPILLEEGPRSPFSEDSRSPFSEDSRSPFSEDSHLKPLSINCSLDFNAHQTNLIPSQSLANL